MTTQKLPGSDRARHGSGDADLTVMIAAHDAFCRDLVSLARAAGTPLPGPGSQPAEAGSPPPAADRVPGQLVRGRGAGY